MSSQPDASRLGETSRLVATRGADRPRAHAGVTEPEVAIFAATERLLADVPLHDLSVAQIIAAAEVSRATFYFYFSSKYAVVTGLLAQVMDEIYEVVQPFIQRQPADPPMDALRKSLEAAADVWSDHRASLRATVEHWHAVPEIRTLWLGVVRRLSEGIALEIERERAEGLAPAGPAARQLATALIWGTERCLYVAGLGIDADLPNERAVVDPVLSLWLGTIYGPVGEQSRTRLVAGKRAAKPASRSRTSSPLR